MRAVTVSAPSNIALIKYMGKTQTSGNFPTNGSLSYTLNHLQSFVRLSAIAAEADAWQPLVGPEFAPMKLSPAGQQRFLAHLQSLKAKWGIQECFLVQSANNFPSDCGLASSASSFAALTMAAARVFQQIRPQPWGEDEAFLSSLSRQGSGSSCRSFFSPWALWRGEGAEAIELPYEHLLHQVVLVEASKKAVSSSQAHKLVAHSSLFPGRIERAEKRLQELTHSLRAGDWRRSFEITWAEFWDMHALFATCTPPFMYMTAGSQQVLSELLLFWQEQGDGPLVTMDAGANIHLLWRPEQAAQSEALREQWQGRFQVMQ